MLQQRVTDESTTQAGQDRQCAEPDWIQQLRSGEHATKGRVG
jgi:hypothetical protein